MFVLLLAWWPWPDVVDQCDAVDRLPEQRPVLCFCAGGDRYSPDGGTVRVPDRVEAGGFGVRLVADGGDGVDDGAPEGLSLLVVLHGIEFGIDAWSVLGFQLLAFRCGQHACGSRGVVGLGRLNTFGQPRRVAKREFVFGEHHGGLPDQGSVVHLGHQVAAVSARSDGGPPPGVQFDQGVAAHAGWVSLRGSGVRRGSCGPPRYAAHGTRLGNWVAPAVPFSRRSYIRRLTEDIHPV